jgi:hypothetical protein
MAADRPFCIAGVVAGDQEREPFILGIRQAMFWLAQAACAPPQIALTFSPELAPPSPERPIDMAMISFIGAASAGAGDLDAVMGRWRERIEAFTTASDAPLFLCTVFRHIASPGGPLGRDGVMAQRERIRRINLLIAELSQSTGAFVIDIDSALAHIGGARLGADYLLQGRAAGAAAGDVIASALLAEGLEGRVASAGLAKALTLHGGRKGVLARLNQMTAGALDGAA